MIADFQTTFEACIIAVKTTFGFNLNMLLLLIFTIPMTVHFSFMSGSSNILFVESPSAEINLVLVQL